MEWYEFHYMIYTCASFQNTWHIVTRQLPFVMRQALLFYKTN